MQPEKKLDVEKLASEYLTSVQSLSEEIAGAVSAIARNDLEALKKHIGSQQRLSSRLLELDSSRHYLSANPAVWAPIASALQTLIRNNRVYSALLVFSGCSHRILLTLCKAYNDSSSQAADRSQAAPTLSCEV
jgi:hypothetical protein